GDPDRRRALGWEAGHRAGAEPHVDTAGSERLLQLGVAAKARDLDRDSLPLENLGLDPDLGSAESKGIGHRLAKPDLIERERIAAPQQRERREQGRHALADAAHQLASHATKLITPSNGAPEEANLATFGDRINRAA